MCPVRQFTGTKGARPRPPRHHVHRLQEHAVRLTKVQFRSKILPISRQRHWGNPIPAVHDRCGDARSRGDQFPVRRHLDSALARRSPVPRVHAETTCPAVAVMGWAYQSHPWDTFSSRAPAVLPALAPTPTTTRPLSPRRRWTVLMPVDNWVIGGISSTPSCTRLLRFGPRSCATWAWLTWDCFLH